VGRLANRQKQLLILVEVAVACSMVLHASVPVGGDKNAFHIVNS
jgi:hypothetical protein